jgi:hypothetical protein
MRVELFFCDFSVIRASFLKPFWRLFVVLFSSTRMPPFPYYRASTDHLPVTMLLNVSFAGYDRTRLRSIIALTNCWTRVKLLLEYRRHDEER